MNDPNETQLKSDASGAPLPQNRCPSCNIMLDAAGTVKGEDDSIRPSPGDMSVCINCGEIMIFTESMTFRALGPGELLDMPPESSATAIHAAQLIKQRGRVR